MHTTYHFNVGDSNTGHVGLCARVCAASPEEAVATLRDLLPTDAEDGVGLDFEGLGPEGYVAVYINPRAFTVDDIDGEDVCSCANERVAAKGACERCERLLVAGDFPGDLRCPDCEADMAAKGW